jgi:tetratricopeptide (TPR) repeat protein
MYVGNKANEASMLIKKLGGVAPAISFALSNRDADLLDQLLPRFPNKKSENFLIGGLVQGAMIGSRIAFEMLEEVATSDANDYSWDVRSRVIGGYSSGASRLDEEARALPIIESTVQRMRVQIDAGEDVTTEQQTRILNALQRTCHGLGKYEDAISVGAEVLALAPSDEAFLFNQSLNLAKAHQPTGAMECIEKLIAIMRARNYADADDDHLVHCIAVLLESNRIPDARELFLVLENQHPFRAQILRNDDDYSGLFS